MPECSEAPDKPESSNGGPDKTQCVESLLQSDTLSSSRQTLVLEERPMAGVLCLVPMEASEALVEAELQGTDREVSGGLTLPATEKIRI